MTAKSGLIAVEKHLDFLAEATPLKMCVTTAEVLGL